MSSHFLKTCYLFHNNNCVTYVIHILLLIPDLPQPYTPTPTPTSHTTTPQTINTETKENLDDENKEKIFIAIIAALCVIIVILLTTLCIVNFYTRGYICCTSMEKHSSRHNRGPRILHEQNGKLNGEVSV